MAALRQQVLFKKRGCGIVIRLEFQVIVCDGIQTSHCLLHVFYSLLGSKVKRGNSGHGIIPVSLYKSHRQLYTIDSLGVPLMLQ